MDSIRLDQHFLFYLLISAVKCTHCASFSVTQTRIPSAVFMVNHNLLQLFFPHNGISSMHTVQHYVTKLAYVLWTLQEADWIHIFA